MLVLFIFSITPKKYLHDLLADHADYYGAAVKESATVSKAGINCHCDSQVVPAPFLAVSFSPAFELIERDSAYVASYHTLFFFNLHITKDSRGPPYIA